MSKEFSDSPFRQGSLDKDPQPNHTKCARELAQLIHKDLQARQQAVHDCREQAMNSPHQYDLVQ